MEYCAHEEREREIGPRERTEKKKRRKIEEFKNQEKNQNRICKGREEERKERLENLAGI